MAPDVVAARFVAHLQSFYRTCTVLLLLYEEWGKQGGVVVDGGPERSGSADGQSNWASWQLPGSKKKKKKLMPTAFRQ